MNDSSIRPTERRVDGIHANPCVTYLPHERLLCVDDPFGVYRLETIRSASPADMQIVVNLLQEAIDMGHKSFVDEFERTA